MLEKTAEHKFTSFVEYLVSENDIDEDNAERLQKARWSTGQACDVIATELGILSDERFASRLAVYCDTLLLSKSAIVLDNGCIKQLFPDIEILKTKATIPLLMEKPILKLVVADPFDEEFLTALGFQTGCHIETCIATRANILEILLEYESSENIQETGSSNETLQSNYASQDDLDRLNSLAMDAPTVKAVQEVIQSAVLSDATDIHIEPEERFLAVRLRIDGMLMPHTQFSMDMHSGIISRIKILSRLNIAERRLPQDGRMRMTIRGIDVDFRVSIVPTMKGEMIVLRVLNRERVKLNFKELGFDRQDIDKIEKLLTNNHGILLVTGPTNSGKSTSLYTALSTFEASEQKIITVEDPVELQLDGINQIQVQPEVGLDFPTALRSVLRQDPDILMIGEIRDAETAQIAIRAAITGHLVLATLHTNSAAGAITRLRDIGIEDYLIAATLRGVVSQRLLRTLCAQCSNNGISDNSECKNCKGTGYSGRTVVCEILVCDGAMNKLINDQASEDKIYSHAIKTGMRTMNECALDLVNIGRTSKEEIARVTSLQL